MLELEENQCVEVEEYLQFCTGTDYRDRYLMICREERIELQLSFSHSFLQVSYERYPGSLAI